MAIKNIKIDEETCIGCGQCATIAEKSFKMGCEGTSEVLDTWKQDDEKKIREAAKSCPTNSIEIEG
ncbi:ferredoxin [Patescibacteria group bacterium]